MNKIDNLKEITSCDNFQAIDKIICFYKKIREFKDLYNLYYPNTNDSDWLGNISDFYAYYSGEELIVDDISFNDHVYTIPFSVPDYDEEGNSIDIIQMGEIYIPDKLFNGKEEELYNEMVYKMIKSSIDLENARSICLDFEIRELEAAKEKLKNCKSKIIMLGSLENEFERKLIK